MRNLSLVREPAAPARASYSRQGTVSAAWFAPDLRCERERRKIKAAPQHEEHPAAQSQQARSAAVGGPQPLRRQVLIVSKFNEVCTKINQDIAENIDGGPKHPVVHVVRGFYPVSPSLCPIHAIHTWRISLHAAVRNPLFVCVNCDRRGVKIGVNVRSTASTRTRTLRYARAAAAGARRGKRKEEAVLYRR